MNDVFVVTTGKWSDEQIEAVFSTPAAVQRIIPAFPADDPPEERWVGETIVKGEGCESEATVTVYRQRMDPDELTFLTDYYSMPVDPVDFRELSW